MTALIIEFPKDKTYKDDLEQEINIILNELKNKKIRGYFVLVSIGDDTDTNPWTGHYSFENDGMKWELIGGVESLKQHLISKTCFIEENEE